jgi:hypothetical protein
MYHRTSPYLYGALGVALQYGVYRGADLLVGPAQPLAAEGPQTRGVRHLPVEGLRVVGGRGLQVGAGHAGVRERLGHGPLGPATLVPLRELRLEHDSV